VNNAPRFVAAYILHRKAREASILNRLQNGESDIPDAGRRDLRQSRSALRQGRRHVGAGASGGSGGARRGRDQRPASIAGVIAWLGSALGRSRGMASFAAGASSVLLLLLNCRCAARSALSLSAVRRSSMSSSRLRMREALVPKSWRP
jgi:hypothetical protein